MIFPQQMLGLLERAEGVELREEASVFWISKCIRKRRRMREQVSRVIDQHQIATGGGHIEPASEARFAATENDEAVTAG